MKPRADNRARWGAAIVVFAFATAWALLMSSKLPREATDVPRFHAYGEAVRRGRMPYRDFRVEYPPGALVAFVLPALLATGSRGYRIAFEMLMALCGIGVIAASYLTLMRLRGHVLAPLAFIAIGILALGPITLGHFDLWPAFLVAAALAALLWERPLLSAVLVGLAIAAKIYPLVLVPIVVARLWRARGRRESLVWLAAAAATVVVSVLPFLILSPGGLAWSIADQARRPLQIESSAAAALLAAHQFGLLQVGLDFSHTSVNLGGASAHLAAAASVVLELAALLYVWIAFARRDIDDRSFIRASTTAVLTFVVLGKVFSPQFLLWLVPLVALLGGSLAFAGCVAVGAAIVLTRAYFPDHWVAVIQLQAGPTWYLVARDMLLLVLLATLVVALARTPTATSPSLPPKRPARWSWRRPLPRGPAPGS